MIALTSKDKLLLSHCLFAAGILCTINLTNRVMAAYGVPKPIHNRKRKRLEQINAKLTENYHQSLRQFVRRTKGLAHYKLGKELGAGTTAIVMQATTNESKHNTHEDKENIDLQIRPTLQVNVCREVAIKVLNKQMSPSAICRNEIDILRRCSEHSHPNIIRLVDHKETINHIMIISQRFGTESMQGRLQRVGRVDERVARHLFLQLGTALKFLHGTLNVVHRDVKPANLLLENDGRLCRLKLCDLGSAAELQQTEGSSTNYKNSRDYDTTSKFPCGAVCGCVGTIAYAAPEVWSGEPYDHTVDWYSAGLVLCKLLAGLDAQPFATPVNMDSRSVREVCFDSCFAETKQVSSDATILIRWLLQQQPEHRPSGAEVMNSKWLKI